MNKIIGAAEPSSPSNLNKSTTTQQSTLSVTANFAADVRGKHANHRDTLT